MPENFKFEQKKQDKVDSLLDDLNFHLNRVEEIKALLSQNIIDTSDTELKEQQRVNVPITQLSENNPLLIQLQEEQKTILNLKAKIDQQL